MWVNPKGLEHILLQLNKYNVPIYITENGIADAEDKLRAQFIRGHLIACSRAIKQGVNLKGYFHWSLLDNYEWHEDLGSWKSTDKITWSESLECHFITTQIYAKIMLLYKLP